MINKQIMEKIPYKIGMSIVFIVSLLFTFWQFILTIALGVSGDSFFDFLALIESFFGTMVGAFFFTISYVDLFSKNKPITKKEIVKRLEQIEEKIIPKAK